jgi:nucleotide-binding universal stress UspA family protein
MSTHFSHIACCIDDTDAGATALAHAATLRELSGGRLSIVHVIAPPPFLVSMAASLGGAPVHDDEGQREAGEMWLDEVAANTPGAQGVLLEGHPGETACDWAAENGVDVMVATRHGGRLERALLGSFAAYLTQHAPCPVLLIPPQQGAEA